MSYWESAKETLGLGSDAPEPAATARDEGGSWVAGMVAGQLPGHGTLFDYDGGGFRFTKPLQIGLVLMAGYGLFRMIGR
ncbi:hotdog family protein [Pseudophaeobacter flagellatus]|uniref:hypothetical protein n=1 Tax=Pseudophaeobacter flagellatus TaxID=2899119 RepID=UPI001E29D29A|nr:hypothetical protein [Pseudophaeobacter flagellatus]MCD9147872.1 hypothetical protein [Pseudophaeobacter flagellatus]